MGIDRCIKCDALVDEDVNVEWYREGFDDACICDSCFDDEYSCPECNSGETFAAHHEADSLAPECNYKECKDCGHQWDHQ